MNIAQTCFIRCRLLYLTTAVRIGVLTILEKYVHRQDSFSFVPVIRTVYLGEVQLCVRVSPCVSDRLRENETRALRWSICFLKGRWGEPRLTILTVNGNLRPNLSWAVSRGVTSSPGPWPLTPSSSLCTTSREIDTGRKGEWQTH